MRLALRPPDTDTISTNRFGQWPLLEEVLIDLLDVKHLLNPAADIVADHEFGEIFPVDQDNALAEEFGGLPCRG